MPEQIGNHENVNDHHGRYLGFSAKTVPEFIAYAKAHPGEINMATSGKGSSVHLAGELFMSMTGVELALVHYRESYIPDMLAGRVQVVISPIPTIVEQIRASKLHAVAVTSDVQSQALPDVPSIAEFVPGYGAIVWNGVVAPKDTSVGVIDQLNSAFTTSLADPQVKAQFANVDSVPKAMTPAEFGRFVAEDTAKWGQGHTGGQYQIRMTACEPNFALNPPPPVRLCSHEILPPER